jgi:hypothetical protein
MAAYVGLDNLFGAIAGTTGTVVSPDKITGGQMGFEQSIEHRDGIAGQDSVGYGMAVPHGNVDFDLQTMVLVGNATKDTVNSLPPVMLFEGGVVAVDMRQHSDAYIDECKLSCEVGGPVKGSVSWIALSETTSAVSAVTANATSTCFEWHSASVELDSGTYCATTFESTIKHNLDAVTCLDAKDSGSQRLPQTVKPGNQEVNLSVEFRTPPDVTVAADAPAAMTFVFTAVNPAGSTFTHTVVGHPVTDPVKFATGGDDILWAVELEGAHNDLDSWTATMA